MRKSILFVINGLGGGGSQRNVCHLANYFCEREFDVHIIVLLDGCKPFYKLNENIKIHYFVREKRNIFDFFYWKKNIKKIIKQFSIERVIAIGYRFGLLCSLCVFKKNKLIIRGTITRKLSLKDKLCFLLLKKKIDLIVAQTKSQIKIYPKFIQNKVVYIPNPFDTFDSNMNKNGFESRRLICIGRFHIPQKRQDFIIQSLSTFLKKHPDFILEFYGEPQIDDDGSTLKNLNELIASLHLENNIKINPTIADPWNTVLPAFAFLCASKYEGMPNALIEGMLRGVVPITTYWEGCDEVIDNEINGFIVNRDDKNHFLSTLERLINDKKLYDTISHNAFTLHREKYKKENVFNQWDVL